MLSVLLNLYLVAIFVWWLLVSWRNLEEEIPIKNSYFIKAIVIICVTLML